jgi:hypothetical protein
MSLRGTWGWLGAAATLALVGCGGTTFSSGLDGGPGGQDAAGTPDGAPGPDAPGPGPQCPPSVPPSGGACPAVGLECEYGTSANPSCDTVAECTSGGWQYAGTACPVGVCPESYSVASMGGGCTPQGLECGYLQGTCSCTYGFGGPILLDGGGPRWICMPLSPGCPSPRPDLGTACTQEGETCDYGACTGGVVLDCSGGAWKRGVQACPAG